MDCGPLGSSVHGISQARILEWIAIPTPGNLLYQGIKCTSLESPALAGEFFTTESPQKPSMYILGCTRSSLLCTDFLQLQCEGLLFIVVHRFFVVVASLVVQHRL